MKKLQSTISILTILILIGTNLFCQENDKEPFYYLNSKRVEFSKVFINPMNIDSVNIDKRTENGKVFIYLKNSESIYYTLADILNNHTKIKDTTDSIIFRINNELIQDTTSIKIDDTYFIYVNVECLTNVKYLPEQLRNLIIVNIVLETKKRAPQTYIRGNRKLLDKYNN